MKDYEIDVAFNGKISIPNFVKVRQTFQELSNVGHRQHGDLNSVRNFLSIQTYAENLYLNFTHCNGVCTLHHVPNDFLVNRSSR
jgi:hypothetical protein